MNPSTSTTTRSSSAATERSSSSSEEDQSCELETGYYLNARQPCETYSQFGRLPSLNTDGWSVLCVAPGRLSDAFGVSSDLEDTTTMFVDKTVKYDHAVLLLDGPRVRSAGSRTASASRYSQ